MGMNMLKTKAKDPTDAVFGIDTNGEVFHTCVSEGPHWIICGQTGSGKSVYANSLLISMMAHALPEELVITWIDPKKVEADAYIGLPYCPIDPVTDMNDAYGLMLFYTWLMDERYDKLAMTHTKKLSEYNEWIEENPEKAKELDLKKMPYVICMIDEYADMTMQNKDVESPIIRLGQKSRASGIHLLISTQRPSVDIISPTLKANIPSRIGLKVADSVNSMIILDESGAEALRGYGDSIVKTVDGAMTRVQGPFITNDEIARIFGYLRENYQQPEDRECDFANYKQIVVDAGMAEWAEDYEDAVPMKDRHLKPKRRFR